MTLFAYLDEFGHIGPYIGRRHPRYKESPVFGLAGFVLPAEAVHGFGTWFFQRKCELLAFEIERSGGHPALWEKKEASLYTLTKLTQYPELRSFTNRLFNKLERLGGFVFYVGVRKTVAPGVHNPNRLYARVFLEAIKRIDGHCAEDCHRAEEFVLILDEHEQRAALLTEAAKSMYGGGQRRRHLIETPFHLESHRSATRPSRRGTGSRGWWGVWGRSGRPGGMARERGVPAVFRTSAQSRQPQERNTELGEGADMGHGRHPGARPRRQLRLWRACRLLAPSRP